MSQTNFEQPQPVWRDLYCNTQTALCVRSHEVYHLVPWKQYNHPSLLRWGENQELQPIWKYTDDFMILLNDTGIISFFKLEVFTWKNGQQTQPIFYFISLKATMQVRIKYQNLLWKQKKFLSSSASQIRGANCRLIIRACEIMIWIFKSRLFKTQG